MKFRKLLRAFLLPLLRLADRVYLRADRQLIRRTSSLDLIPDVGWRRGGKVAYAEWAHVAGIFQTIIARHLNQELANPTILDIGCGTGLLAIACYPLLLDGGKYIGIDVQRQQIEFCKSHYPADKYEFMHLDVRNADYAPEAQATHVPWNLADNSVDMVTALSVWTHFNEADAIFYFSEINRVLKPGGTAIITFFLLDEAYEHSLPQRSQARSPYHKTPSNTWIFDQASSPSGNWKHPGWVAVPENAIGVTPAGIQQLLENTDLHWIETYPGNWKERFGLYFQGILVFDKA